MLDDEPSVPSQEETDRAVHLHSQILKLAGAVQDISGADMACFLFILPALCLSILTLNKNC